MIISTAISASVEQVFLIQRYWAVSRCTLYCVFLVLLSCVNIILVIVATDKNEIFRTHASGWDSVRSVRLFSVPVLPTISPSARLSESISIVHHLTPPPLQGCRVNTVKPLIIHGPRWKPKGMGYMGLWVYRVILLQKMGFCSSRDPWVIRIYGFIRPWIMRGLTVCTIDDVLIALSMVWTLRAMKPMWHSTQQILRSFSINALTTGAVVACVTILTILPLFAQVLTMQVLLGGFIVIMGRVYSLTIITNFIHRATTFEAYKRSNTQDIPVYASSAVYDPGRSEMMPSFTVPDLCIAGSDEGHELSVGPQDRRLGVPQTRGQVPDSACMMVDLKANGKQDSEDARKTQRSPVDSIGVKTSP
ncbi:hypothetical protein MKEN_01380900 [Mycena kentingensis (nom. inval.)]|nr:hypothetical protein MKEN_01380900 [Mycena kentingensis (nom. inval.)]